ncbi:MAG: hypothetical protein WD627_01600 [Actinomycetota bacterium]
MNSARRAHKLSALCLLSALAVVFTPAHAESPTGFEIPRHGVEAGAQVLSPAFGEGVWRPQTVFEPRQGRSPLRTSQGVLSAVAVLVFAAFATAALLVNRHPHFGVLHLPASPRGPPPG